MKLGSLIRMLFLSLILGTSVLISGCGGDDGGGGTFTANVVVQLTGGGSNYKVDRMTVSIQKTGSVVLTGVTGTDGIARISVPEAGNYQVISVSGVDASGLALGSEGREFVKASPLADPYPNLVYTFSGTVPVVSVTVSGSDNPVSAPVPSIRKVTVLATGTATGSPTAIIAAGTTSFPGRVMLANIDYSDIFGGIVIQSNDPNLNRLILYPNMKDGNPLIRGGYFYGGPAGTGTSIGTTSSYLQAGSIFFEAPGGGDWALGYNLSTVELRTRNQLGGADETRNFPDFNGGANSNGVLRSFSTTGGSGQTYKFDYRIFMFTTL